MPIALLIIGLILIISAVRGTTKTVFALFESDGQAFISWFLIIIILGVVGISKTLRPVSNSFLVLVLVVFTLKNSGGIFSSFKQLTVATPSSADATPTSAATNPAVSPALTQALQQYGANQSVANLGKSVQLYVRM